MNERSKSLRNFEDLGLPWYATRRRRDRARLEGLPRRARHGTEHALLHPRGQPHPGRRAVAHLRAHPRGLRIQVPEQRPQQVPPLPIRDEGGEGYWVALYQRATREIQNSLSNLTLYKSLWNIAVPNIETLIDS